jgi:AraC family transcriptional regulator
MALDCVPITFGSPRSVSMDVDWFRVTSAQFEPDLDLPRHTHDRATVAVVLRGSMEELVGTRSHDCPRATVLMEPAGEPHGNRFEGAGAAVVIVQPDPAAGDVLDPFVPMLARAGHARDARVAVLATTLARELHAPDDLTPLAVTGLVLELLARTARLADPPRRGRRPPSWLVAARDQLHDRFAEPLRVSEVAAAAGVHPVHLTREFRAAYGVTVSEYVRGLRVDWAAHRLATSGEPIAQIATRAGFTDQSHLTRAMRDRHGLTPLEWRSLSQG